MKKSKRPTEGEKIVSSFQGDMEIPPKVMSSKIDRAIRRRENLIVENICRNIMLERDGRWSDNASLCAWIGMWSKDCPPTRKAVIERCRIKAAVLEHLRKSKGAKP